jgi:hypothetical protein
MQDRIKRAILTGGLSGLLVAGTLALPSVLPPAVADDEPFQTLLSTAKEIFPKPIKADTFVKPDWTVEDWVATEVIEQVVVRKIGYGRTTFVTIATTATGTYSSDGLESPNIRYPGIVRNSEPSWFRMTVPYEGGRVTITPDSTCIRTQYGKIC